MNQRHLLVVNSAVEVIKNIMGYSDEPRVECKYCTWFVERGPSVKDECKVNTFNIQIDKDRGRCFHFVRKTKSDAQTDQT